MAPDTPYWDKQWSHQYQPTYSNNQHQHSFGKPSDSQEATTPSFEQATPSTGASEYARQRRMPQYDDLSAGGDSTYFKALDQSYAGFHAAPYQRNLSSPAQPSNRQTIYTATDLRANEYHTFGGSFFDSRDNSLVAEWPEQSGDKNIDKWFGDEDDQVAGLRRHENPIAKEYAEYQQDQEDLIDTEQDYESDENEIQPPVWHDSITNSWQARAWLSAHPMNLVRVSHSDDNIEAERAKITAHARALFDALLEAPQNAQSNLAPEPAKYYNRYQASGMAELEELLGTVSGCKRAQSFCFVAVEEAFALHGLRIHLSRNQMKVDEDLSLPDRILHMTSCLQVKQVGVKLILDRDDTRSNLVKNPKKLLKDRLHCAKNNSGKKVKNEIAMNTLSLPMKTPRKETANLRQRIDDSFGASLISQSLASRSSGSTTQDFTAHTSSQHSTRERSFESVETEPSPTAGYRLAKRSAGEWYPKVMQNTIPPIADFNGTASSHANVGQAQIPAFQPNAMPTYSSAWHPQPSHHGGHLESYNTPSFPLHGIDNHYQHGVTAFGSHPAQTLQDFGGDVMMAPLQREQVFARQSPLHHGWGEASFELSDVGRNELGPNI